MIKVNFYTIFIFCLFISELNFAQVGVNTEAPRAGLDVQGSLGIRNKIYLGGDNATLGKLGETGSVLVSQGSGLPPVWKVIRRPDFNPFIFTIFNNASSETQTGVTVTAVTGDELHTLNQTLASFGGSQIAGLEKGFQIDNSGNIAILTFESIAQTNSTTAGHGVDFSCGIFVDDALKGIKVYTISQTGGTYPFYTFDLLVAVNGLVVGPHTAKVACKRRANINSFTGDFTVGQPASGVTNLNNFMTKSSLVIETYEKPSPSNSVPVYNP